MVPKAAGATKPFVGPFVEPFMEPFVEPLSCTPLYFMRVENPVKRSGLEEKGADQLISIRG
jgi:hypothetical protein